MWDSAIITNCANPRITAGLTDLAEVGYHAATLSEREANQNLFFFRLISLTAMLSQSVIIFHHWWLGQLSLLVIRILIIC